MIMKKLIISLTTSVFLFGCVIPANAQFLRGMARLLGAKEDSPIMTICDVGDKIGNAVVAKKLDNTINSYEAITDKYEKDASKWNDVQEQKLNAFYNEKERFMIDYCMQHGFYDLWVERYGSNWFESAGRTWFESQNDLRIKRGQDELLPWHLRGNAEEEVRYNPVESSLSGTILNAIGMSSNDVAIADKWIESDKYGKRDMVIDAAFDIAGKHSANPEMLESFRQLTKANNKYLKNKKSGNPHAITDRNIDFANIVFNAAEVSKEKKKRFLADKRAISEELKAKGIYADDEIATEIAGQILSIQKDKSMTEAQKNDWLSKLGYYGREKDILQIADEINRDEIADIPEVDNGPTQEEIEAQLQKERAEQQRIEKENAIMEICNTSIEKYVFDSTELTEEQKNTLGELVSIMKKFDDISLTIIGHTCSKGYKSVNYRIGLRRAEVAKNYLVNEGVECSRISTKSMGEDAPKLDNSKIENRKFNRRLEFVVE